MRVKIFADGADVEGIRALAANPLVRGFTTNPTLMRKAGVTSYEAFAAEALEAAAGLPISFEVLSDTFEDMERQALTIAGWGENVVVKVPVTNSAGQRSDGLIRRLRDSDVRLNVTAVFTVEQVEWVTEALAGGPPANISVFAGRIADAGIDPVPTMEKALAVMSACPELELIWASPREVLNVVQADAIGCHIITVTHDLLAKLPGLGRDLDEFSLETVKMFLSDAIAANYQL